MCKCRLLDLQVCSYMHMYVEVHTHVAAHLLQCTSFFLHPGTEQRLEICRMREVGDLRSQFALTHTLTFLAFSLLHSFCMCRSTCRKSQGQFTAALKGYRVAITHLNIGVLPSCSRHRLVTKGTHWHSSILRYKVELAIFYWQ